MKFYGVTDSNISVKVAGKDVESGPYYDEELHTLIVGVPEVDIYDEIKVAFNNKVAIADNNAVSQVFKSLHNSQIKYILKENIYNYVKNTPNALSAIGTLQTLNLEPMVFGGLCEILSAKFH